MWATGQWRGRCARARSRRTFELDDLDAALLADDAAVLHALVLAAEALEVFDRAEDLGAEETVALRLEGPVVDSLGLLDLTERPSRGSSLASDDPKSTRSEALKSLKMRLSRDFLEETEAAQASLIHGAFSAGLPGLILGSRLATPHLRNGIHRSSFAARALQLTQHRTARALAPQTTTARGKALLPLPGSLPQARR